ncbi:diguanylate cyclase (GGDEF)-like protein/PAS domain S-box-containing protein [Paenibacillus phyllosphaerae]|uniref:Diguanylate cyclase (GGDEF)-like protein/PAS domain S-box-containing protein n=1 Tax=Paenibacillus phyllosphaerae TaxID=274593 RepID=A0A7W5FNB9_9BACL|nr:diguanylate cyclase [Paenibacillus phyllosphaerae]MBB3111145.1 diguanylate cyclase (GGDEF)-like protein/PAS domain S-box-containing protein [Paenibacillus phyllosphaerae]
MLSFFVADFFIIVAALFISMFFFKKLPDRFHSTIAIRLRIGFYQGVFGTLMMMFSIQLAPAAILDLRLVPVISAAYFGGMRSSVIAAGTIAVVRLFSFGGPSASAASAALLLIGIGLLTGWVADRIHHYWKMWSINLVIITLSTLGSFGVVLQSSNLPLSNLWWLIAFQAAGGLFVSGCVYFLKNTYDEHFLNRKLYTLIHSFQQTDTVQDIYEKALRELTDLFECERASIVMVDNNRYTLAGVLTNGEYVNNSERIELGDIWGLVHAIDGRSTLYPDWTIDRPAGKLDHNAYSRGVRSSIHVPIKHKSHVIGLMNLGSFRRNFFSAHKIKFVEDLMPSIGMALALNEAEARFASIVESSNDGIIITDGDLNIVAWNQGATEVFGYIESEIIGVSVRNLMPAYLREHYVSIIHELSSLKGAAAAGRKTREGLGLHKDGTLFPIELSFTSWAASGQIYFSSIIRNITDRKRAQEEILRLKQDLADTIHYQHGITLKYKKMDGTFIYTLADGQMLQEIGFSPETVVGRPISDVIPPALSGDLYEKYEKAWNGEGVECEIGYRHKTFLLTLNPIFKEGSVSEVVVSMSDMSARKQAEDKLIEANQRLERLSNRDGLTGLANRRSFDHQLERALREGSDSGVPVSLVLLDIDSFKIYNDTYGHQKGDACLKQVARILGETAEHQGFFAARYGGEEFACVMLGADAAAAQQFAELVRAEVARKEMPNERATIPFVTVSIGVASWHREGDGFPPDMVEIADQALYEAKKTGRNRVSRGKTC